MIGLTMELLDVRTAFNTAIGAQGASTGIVKESATLPIAITDVGLKGDFQVNRRVNGGLEKAIYQYPSENYAVLIDAFGDDTLQQSPLKNVGENFSTVGATESDIHIGDILRVGSGLIQVSQPRMPCWTLNHLLGNAYVTQFMMSQGISGWYCRVLQEGTVSAGDKVTVIDRLSNSISVKEIWVSWRECISQGHRPKQNCSIPGLSHEWRIGS